MKIDLASLGAESAVDRLYELKNKNLTGDYIAQDKQGAQAFPRMIDGADVGPENKGNSAADGQRRFASHGPDGCRNIALCFDRESALRRFVGILGDADPIDIYFSNHDFARISPNMLFDEQWYVDAHEDVRDAIAKGNIYSGFVHFVVNGVYEGRSPNPTLDLELVRPNEIMGAAPIVFDVESYTQSYRIVRKFLECFPLIDATRFYHLYGRRLGHTVWDLHGVVKKPLDDLLSYEFDHDYYCSTYLDGKVDRAAALDHYTNFGIREGNSPNQGFDELWYRTFYSDISQAVDTGEIKSGFHHYLISGKKEGRRQHHDLRYALESRMAGITDPRLVQRADDIAQRMRCLPHRVVSHAEPRIWFCLPMLNPDISFGGYKAVFELIKATARSGRAIGIFVTEDPVGGIDYFAYRERDRELVSVIKSATYLNRSKDKEIQISINDIFVVYSVWDAYIVQPLLKATRTKRFLLLAQEFEPIFYECGSTRALTQDAYHFDHVPLYNSRFLKTYFAAHGLGPFGAGRQVREGVDYFTFEHVPTRLMVEADRKDTSTRTLAFYARPEMHAARNLFELGYLALRKLCNEGVFDERWRFVGLGSLQDDHVLPLGADHRIEMIQKMPHDEYARFMSSIDVGLSLMLAPHPSVVPFEFAATGAVVVTNTYENRSARDLEAICKNIVPCTPTLAGVEAALRVAVARAEDFELRQSQRLIGADKSWKETFSPEMLDEVFRSLAPESPARSQATQSA